MKRAIVIVLDSVGVGALPDAERFGDASSNTLAHVLDAAPIDLPNLQRLGLGNLLFHPKLPAAALPQAIVAKLVTISPGKDTITGHWEMMGYPQSDPFPTYPDGFPETVLERIRALSGRPIFGNVAASGTEIIQRLGDAAVAQGGLIVYTSADSVLQIAAHEEVVPLSELYRICEQTHAYLLESEHKVARVIARPFVGSSGQYQRTEQRHDYSAKPGHTLLDTITEQGGRVLAVGKIVDIFAGQGITRSFRSRNNREGIATTLDLIRSGSGELIFTNLVDFDMLYGHRNDAPGYALALQEFDQALPQLLASLSEQDLLIITADHGCDPTTAGSDHSREYVPCLVYARSVGQGQVLASTPSLCAVGATVADWLGVTAPDCAVSLLGGSDDAGC